MLLDDTATGPYVLLSAAMVNVLLSRARLLGTEIPDTPNPTLLRTDWGSVATVETRSMQRHTQSPHRAAPHDHRRRAIREVRVR